jgi:cytoskeleton protein RodZ
MSAHNEPAQSDLIPIRPGDVLRHAREKAGLTLERASELSRIKPSVLHAIEEDETSEIPSVYLKGYIRNYARFLGVEPSRIEKVLETIRGSEPPVRSVFTVPNRRGRMEKWLKASSYLAASAIIGVLAWQFTHEAVRFTQRDARLGGDAVEPAPSAEQGGETSASGEGRSSNTHLSASIAAMEVLEQRGDLGSKAAAEQAWAAIGGRTAGDLPAPAGAVGGNHRLAISTSADTWVEILDGEGAQLELDLIRAGARREYNGAEPFRMMIGRASAVVVTLDGETIDLGPYTRGNVARLVLDDASGADTDTGVDEAQTAGPEASPPDSTDP